MSSDSARETAVTDESVDGGQEADQPVDHAAGESGDTVEQAQADDRGGDDQRPDEQGSDEQGSDERHDDESDGGHAEVAAEGRRRDRMPRRVLLGSAALALASFIVAAVFGVLWLVAATGDRADIATSRNAVVDAARHAVQAVTEIDYRNPDRFFERSRAVSTEEFGKQLTKAEDSLRKALSKAKTTVETNVQDVAVQELNDREGTATFLAVVSTDISQGDRNATKVMRLKGQMERVSTGDGKEWKLAGLSQVPVVGSGAAAPKSGENPAPGAQGGSAQGSGKGSGPGK